MNKIAVKVQSFFLSIKILMLLMEKGYTWKDGKGLLSFEKGINRENKQDFGYLIDQEEKKVAFINGDFDGKAQRNAEKVVSVEEFNFLGEVPDLTCDHCGVVIEDEEFDFVDGRIICQECLDEHYTRCSDCNALTLVDGAHVDQRGDCICDECFNDHYFVCHACGEIFHNDDAHDGYGDTYCHECFHDRFIECQECGNTVNMDDAYYEEDSDQYLCEHCYHERKANYVMGYHDFSNWKFLFNPSEEKPRTYFGLEIETQDNRGQARNEFPDHWDVENRKFVVFERDGSISGIECITHPFTYEWFKTHEEPKNLLKALKKSGFTVDDGAGIHVHISKKAFTEMGMLKLVYIIRRHKEDIEDNIGDRKMGHYCRCNHDLIYGDTVSRKLREQSNDRYQAINFCKTPTVELRFFKSTLEFSMLDAIMDFCNNLVQICKLPMVEIAKMSYEDITGFHKRESQVKKMKKIEDLIANKKKKHAKKTAKKVVK